MAWERFTRIVFCSTALIVLAGTWSLRGDSGSFYVQNNLVSDIKGAARTDGNLVNAWGLDASPTGPWWVNANGTGLANVYDSNGAQFMAPITIPVSPLSSGTGAPTGIVFNIFNGTGDFAILPNEPAFFIFATEDGTISAWNQTANPSQALVKVITTNGVYKGVTIGQNGTTKLLYAANFRSGTVDVFDTNFTPVSAAMLAPNAFFDSLIPAGYAPFNVQNINGSIFVTYAQQDSAKHDDVKGAGKGFVDQFLPDGTFVKRLQHGDWFNAPWGVALAPADFGDLSGLLLVGNFGSGQIASFDMQSGDFKGMMLSHGNHPVAIDGLWGIRFGNGAMAGPANFLFFAAGIQGENHGLFGSLRPKHDGEGDDNQDDQGDNGDSQGHHKH
jgi:uncharacterized protein (TIGR03118 family)